MRPSDPVLGELTATPVHDELRIEGFVEKHKEHHRAPVHVRIQSWFRGLEGPAALRRAAFSLVGN